MPQQAPLQLAPSLPQRPTRTRRALGLTAAWCLGLCACGAPADPPRDVVVVLLDALRADALGCYGAARATSPQIDRFAAEAVRVEQAYSTAAYTLASVASLFTGERPAAHRVLGLASNVLPPDLTTLAEAFGSAGWGCAGFSSNPHVVEAGGFARGFEHFEYLPRDRFDVHSIPAAVGERFFNWWNEQAGRDRLAYVHVLPPHQPYDPPAPFAQLFGADQVPRELGLTDRLTALQQAGASELPQDLLAQIRARYDANVAYADHWFGELLLRLDQLPGAEQRLVVLLGDHGEAFGEHGDILHGANAFAEMTRVPLLLRAAGLRPGMLPGLVTLADLPASLCELAGVPWQGAGQSFAAELRDGVLDQEREALSRSMGTRPLWALRSGPWSYVQQSAGEFEALFNREADALEMRDLAAAQPAEVARLRARLEALLAADQAVARQRVKPRAHQGDREALKSLGYLEER